jgi:hypothetical protein
MAGLHWLPVGSRLPRQAMHSALRCLSDEFKPRAGLVKLMRLRMGRVPDASSPSCLLCVVLLRNPFVLKIRYVRWLEPCLVVEPDQKRGAEEEGSLRQELEAALVRVAER